MSFEGLAKRLTPTLKRITYKLNGRFTFMDHDDLFQEALMHLWTHFKEGSLTDKTDSYMLQGCYFHLKNYIRKTQDSATLVSLNEIIDEDGARLDEVLAAADIESFEYVDGKLQVEALEEHGMTPRERQVLSLCLEGLTTREIGCRLGVSHVSIVKIRNKIREKYEQLNGQRPGTGYQN